MMQDLISRQAAIDALKHNQNVYSHNFHDDPIDKYTSAIIAADIDSLVNLPSVQPEIIRCKDCKFGEQDEVGRWFCRSLGCQIGNEDGSGFCADAERRTDE